MTIQEYKDELDRYTGLIAEDGASPGFIAGCRRMAHYAVSLAEYNLGNVDISEFKLDKLEDGKCYMVSFNPYDVTLKMMSDWIKFYNDAVAYRGIEFLPKFDSTKIEEVDKED